MRIERISKEEGLDLLQKEHVAQVCQVRVKEEAVAASEELWNVRFFLVCQENENTFLVSYNNGIENFLRVCVSSFETISDVFDKLGYKGRYYLFENGGDTSDIYFCPLRFMISRQIVIC